MAKNNDIKVAVIGGIFIIVGAIIGGLFTLGVPVLEWFLKKPSPTPSPSPTIQQIAPTSTPTVGQAVDASTPTPVSTVSPIPTMLPTLPIQPISEQIAEEPNIDYLAQLLQSAMQDSTGTSFTRKPIKKHGMMFNLGRIENPEQRIENPEQKAECEKSDSIITCYLILSSEHRNRKVGIGSPSCIYDHLGNKYEVIHIQMGNESTSFEVKTMDEGEENEYKGDYVGRSFSPEIPVQIILRFGNIPEHMTTIRRVDVYVYDRTIKSKRNYIIRFDNPTL